METEAKLRKLKITKQVLGFGLVVLLLGASVAINLLQIRAANSETKKVAGVQTGLADVNQRMKILESKVAKSSMIKPPVSKEPIVIPTISDMKVSINETIRFSVNAMLVGVKITAQNSTKQDIEFTVNSFKLKDVAGNTYTQLTDGDFYNREMPPGFVTMANQSVAAGETVTGVLIYRVNDTSVSRFLLTQDTRNFPTSINRVWGS